jgi:hypothetical protein
VLRVVDEYTGELGTFDVGVTEGMVTISRTRGAPQVSRDVEERALRALATTVGGVVDVHVVSPAPAGRSVGASA